MIYPYNVADTLILFQPKRTDYAHLLGLSPPCLESFRRAWIGYLLSPTYLLTYLGSVDLETKLLSCTLSYVLLSIWHRRVKDDLIIPYT